ncbi:MAG: RNA polymerase sigma factor [Clostridia bacterium]|nr:RNA polymerase sigma factor [Clostridia bacterium]
MDKNAFEQMVMDELPGLYRIAQGILRHPADAQDAVQQAVLKAWERLGTIRPGTGKAYLTRIVINQCRDIQRARRRVVPSDVIPDRAEPLSRLMELREAVDRLPEKLRIPFLLVYMEGHSTREAADIAGITEFALKSRLKRARKKLQLALGEEDT